MSRVVQPSLPSVDLDREPIATVASLRVSVRRYPPAICIARVTADGAQKSDGLQLTLAQANALAAAISAGVAVLRKAPE